MQLLFVFISNFFFFFFCYVSLFVGYFLFCSISIMNYQGKIIKWRWFQIQIHKLKMVQNYWNWKSNLIVWFDFAFHHESMKFYLNEKNFLQRKNERKKNNNSLKYYLIVFPLKLTVSVCVLFFFSFWKFGCFIFWLV